MTTLEIVLISVVVALVVAIFFEGRWAYFNGAVDGYGYAKEPNCPGYKGAGEILRKSMAHRWPELCPCAGRKIIPPQGGNSTAPARVSIS